MKTYLYAFLLAVPAIGLAQPQPPGKASPSAQTDAAAPSAASTPDGPAQSRTNAFARAATTTAKPTGALPAPAGSVSVSTPAPAAKTSRFGGPAKPKAPVAPTAGRPTQPHMAGGSNAAMPNLPPPMPVLSVEPLPEVEEVPAVRMGTVNGEYIYRGTATSTYLFEEAKTHKIVRKPIAAAAAGSSAAGQDRALNPGKAPPNLPSTVGKPASSEPPSATPSGRPTSGRPGTRPSSTRPANNPAPATTAATAQEPADDAKASPPAVDAKGASAEKTRAAAAKK